MKIFPWLDVCHDRITPVCWTWGVVPECLLSCDMISLQVFPSYPTLTPSGYLVFLDHVERAQEQDQKGKRVFIFSGTPEQCPLLALPGQTCCFSPAPIQSRRIMGLPGMPSVPSLGVGEHLVLVNFFSWQEDIRYSGAVFRWSWDPKLVCFLPITFRIYSVVSLTISGVLVVCSSEDQRELGLWHLVLQRRFQ